MGFDLFGRLRLRGRGAFAPRRRCFYCNQTSVPRRPLPGHRGQRVLVSQRSIDSGTEAHDDPLTIYNVATEDSRRDWYCELCENWNLFDAQGELVDNYHALGLQPPPPHLPDTDPTITATASGVSTRLGSPTLSPTRLDHGPLSRAGSPLHSPFPSPSLPGGDGGLPQPPLTFCDVCLHNQQIGQQALGDYIPDEDDPQYAERCRTVKDYQLNLERLYPPVCPDCQQRVDRRLRVCDRKIKSKVLQSSLRRSKDQRHKARIPRIVKPGLGARLKWYALALLWMAMWLGTNVMLLGGALQPDQELQAAECPVAPFLPARTIVADNDHAYWATHSPNTNFDSLGARSFIGVSPVNWPKLISVVHRSQLPLALYGMIILLLMFRFDPTWIYVIRRQHCTVIYRNLYRRYQTLAHIIQALAMLSLLLDNNGFLFYETALILYNICFFYSLYRIRVKDPIKFRLTTLASPVRKTHPYSSTPTPFAIPGYRTAQPDIIETQSFLNNLRIFTDLTGDDTESIDSNSSLYHDPFAQNGSQSVGRRSLSNHPSLFTDRRQSLRQSFSNTPELVGTPSNRNLRHGVQFTEPLSISNYERSQPTTPTRSPRELDGFFGAAFTRSVSFPVESDNYDGRPASLQFNPANFSNMNKRDGVRNRSASFMHDHMFSSNADTGLEGLFAETVRVTDPRTPKAWSRGGILGFPTVLQPIWRLCCALATWLFPPVFVSNALSFHQSTLARLVFATISLLSRLLATHSPIAFVIHLAMVMYSATTTATVLVTHGEGTHPSSQPPANLYHQKSFNASATGSPPNDRISKGDPLHATTFASRTLRQSSSASTTGRDSSFGLLHWITHLPVKKIINLGLALARLVLGYLLLVQWSESEFPLYFRLGTGWAFPIRLWQELERCTWFGRKLPEPSSILLTLPAGTSHLPPIRWLPGLLWLASGVTSPVKSHLLAWFVFPFRLLLMTASQWMYPTELSLIDCTMANNTSPD
ncbi:hypothetical protein BJ085DRAFT_35219 [Dimargaris cristalligena]|uniref:Ima1 N-terminal domain-containing protein n=1 Tax=Dimargaris cristalligena TaxID=215637 RepID=A0A4Q0A2R3_9FUNG|nr:hypothetical protein BJ085DRAFT_35219 [Dimargaris cristalligena]|eukprot:RKP39480.1 hypothetical protein BJ085DRAFT_35219 [Dimargaris cristalligena]